MHDHVGGLAGDLAPALPVIAGARWFDAEDRPFVLRVECPLAFEEMVAALYGVVETSDITSDEELCGSVAVTLLAGGMGELKARAEEIRRGERHGVVGSPAFLAMCRQRVAALLKQ